MSGINDALQDTIAKYRDLRSFAPDQQQLVLRDFCYKHPEFKFLDAVNYLMSGMTIMPSTLPNAPLNPLQRRPDVPLPALAQSKFSCALRNTNGKITRYSYYLTAPMDRRS